MNFSINLGNWNSIFAVPTTVVDKHIKLAGCTQLKVLLWILRHAGENFSVNDIASALSMHSADVKDAMQYWIETELIGINNNIISPAQIAESKVLPDEYNKIDETSELPSQKDKQSSIKSTQNQPRLLSRPQKPDSLYVSQRINDSSEISSLMQEAQIILGRPISSPDAATLVMLHDNDGLPVDVIIMLMQYAVSIGKNSMKYIEKTAISWANEEIDSLEKAEKKIRLLSQRKDCWNIVKRAIGIDNRSPSAKEEEASERWISQWGFDEQMIREAYNRCIDSKGKYILSYMDSIIKRWYSAGIKNIEQANQERLTNKINSSSYSKTDNKDTRSPSYNIEEYEKFSIFD